MTYDVAFEEAPAQTFTSVRRTLKEPDLRPFVEQSIAEMRALLRDAGIPEAGPPFAIYHDKVTVEAPGDVEVCVPCSLERSDSGVIEHRTIVATRAAVVAVPTADVRYPEILAAYDAATAAILDAGFLLGAAPREVYDGPTTRIVWPLGARAEAAHATSETHAR